ncbi:MAG: helix-turn-helix domain-containing protein, partial [Chloroflexota bacterium]|nr:helix-turn-helix domain-containing protein [Chloroflexota bacterium]
MREGAVTADPRGNGSDSRPLREVRAERLLSIRELARLAGVAPSTVYLIEAGRTTPRPAVMRRLAATLGADARQIEEFRRAIDRSARPR